MSGFVSSLDSRSKESASPSDKLLEKSLLSVELASEISDELSDSQLGAHCCCSRQVDYWDVDGSCFRFYWSGVGYWQ